MINWKDLENDTDLETIKLASQNTPQVIFKHSTRCSVSSMVKSRLEKNESPVGIDFHFLDLIANRNISNKVADIFSVHHESPQILIIKNGECIYDESHTGIRFDDILSEV